MIAIVGAGFYGCYIALTLANKGHKVTLFDPLNTIESATLHCQARLHNGMFYIRSHKDLLSCARNFTKFFKVFKPYIYKDFNSYYLIDKNSKVDYDTYLRVCRNNHIKVEPVTLDYINKNSVQGIIKAKEFSIDTEGLLNNLRDLCYSHPNITFYRTRVVSIINETPIVLQTQEQNYYVADKVILACYSDNFRLLSKLGLLSPNHTSNTMWVVMYNDNLPKDCHAVVDGNYWSSIVTPRGKLLTNSIPHNGKFFDNTTVQIKQYIPEFKPEYKGYATVKKTVLDNTREATITKYGNIYSVFSGKLTNIFDIINQIEAL